MGKRRSTLRSCSLLALAALFLPAAALGTPPAKGEGVFSSLDAWVPVDETRSFGPGELWQHINGGADVFLHYGFEELRERDIVSGDITLTVGVYDMGSALNAFGMYKVEASDELEDLGTGAASQGTPPYQWLLLKDRYYVKVEYFEGEADAEQGQALLHEIAAALPGEDSLPEALGWLPAEGRIAGSEGFSPSAYLGLGELGPAVHADYLVDGETYPVFLLLPGPEKNTKSLWKALSDKWERRRLDRLSVLTREVPYKGLIGVLKTAKGLMGVAGAEDEKKLKILLTDLVPGGPTR